MSKKNLILGGILIALIAVVYIYQGPMKVWKENNKNNVNFFADLDIDKINKISINKEGEVVVLEKIGENWKIFGTKDFYAGNSYTDNLINSLNNAKESKFNLVSSNKDKKQDFVTDENGIIVKLFIDDNENLEFIIGKMGVEYTDTYVSQNNINETYSIKSSLFSAFGVEDFRDNTIFTSNKVDISKLRFQYPNREFTIEKISGDEGELWQGVLPYNFDVDQDKVDKILDTMSNLSAIKIPEQSFDGTSLDKSLIIVQATGENIDNILMLGAKNNNYYYAKRGNSDNIYLITEEQREGLDNRIDDLK